VKSTFLLRYFLVQKLVPVLIMHYIVSFLFVWQVTDDLFDEIATKVLNEDETAGEGSTFLLLPFKFVFTFMRS
jgi:hypothetical protein